MEKYIARNIDSLHRIDRGVTPSIPSHRPTTKNWCVVVVAAGAVERGGGVLLRWEPILSAAIYAMHARDSSLALLPFKNLSKMR